MKIWICADESQLPGWLSGGARETAITGLDEEGCVVVALRAGGDVQVVPEGHVDAEVMRDLLIWAAGAK